MPVQGRDWGALLLLAPVGRTTSDNRRIPLPRQVSVDLIAAAFDVFNRPNWTISTQENNALFGRRTAGLYRTMQLGFRVLF